jgi:hypothetical protein
MKVKQLIDALKKQPADAEVLVWIDGERLWITDVDDSFVKHHNTVDINTTKDIHITTQD